MDEDEFYDQQEHTVPCPVCKQPVYEDALQCPGCGNYLSDADFRKRPSKWMVLLVGVLIAMWFLQYVFSTVNLP
jgi:predicted nucleic acid-binding Zn ribbon protein